MHLEILARQLGRPQRCWSPTVPRTCGVGRSLDDYILHALGRDPTRACGILLPVLSHEGAGWSLPPLFQRVHTLELNYDVSVLRRNTKQRDRLVEAAGNVLGAGIFQFFVRLSEKHALEILSVFLAHFKLADEKCGLSSPCEGERRRKSCASALIFRSYFASRPSMAIVLVLCRSWAHDILNKAELQRQGVGGGEVLNLCGLSPLGAAALTRCALRPTSCLSLVQGSQTDGDAGAATANRAYFRLANSARAPPSFPA